MKRHMNEIVIGLVIIVSLAVSFFIGGDDGIAGIKDDDAQVAATDTGLKPDPPYTGSQAWDTGTGDAAAGGLSNPSGTQQPDSRNPLEGAPGSPGGSSGAQGSAESRGAQAANGATEQPGDAGGQMPQNERVSEGATGNGEPDGGASPQDAADGGTQQGENPERELTVTLTISVATILDNMDRLDSEKVDLVPQDGVIFSGTVVFYEGESVFNVLLREVRRNRIHMEHTNSPIYNSAYIEGIGNIYEFDAGERSGWIYCVNGVFPNYGCSRYILQDGDQIVWHFTCDRGADIGGEAASGSYNWG